MKLPKFITDVKKIRFDETEHKYWFGDKQLISVTTFIKEFTEEFDKTGAILKRCAAKEGIPPEELKARWKKKADDSCVVGTKFHEDAEHFIKTGEILNGENKDLIEKFKLINHPKGKVFSETIVFDIDLGIAGMVDYIELYGNKIVVKDFKTNSKCPDNYAYGKMMKPPLDFLPASKLSIYALQINIYLYLLSSNYGYEVGNDNCLYWIDRKKRDIKVIPISYSPENVISAISHWTYIKNLTPEQKAAANAIDTNDDIWID